MKGSFQSHRIGMLGGGQLGRMLLQKAADFDLDMAVLDPDEDAPCRYLCKKFVRGSFNDFDTVYSFGKDCDIITIEIEHVNVQALEMLEAEGKTICPSPSIIKIVQDKGLQKEFYRENNFPTADFYLIQNKNEIQQHASYFPFMQKLRKGGYDGKGVIALRNEADIENAFDAPSVLEKMIGFVKEISVIVSRNSAGEVSCFPAVEMEFNSEANLVEYLFSPAAISKKTGEEAVSIAKQIAEKLKLTGVLAVEFFVMENGKLLVNEIAPRPHNSGHQTIEANITSQYEQHLRALLSLPPGKTDMIQPSVMVNILGEKGFEGKAVYSGMEKIMSVPGAHIHLYGKKNTRPFRKMGHVTVTASSLEAAKKSAIFVKENLQVISELHEHG